MYLLGIYLEWWQGQTLVAWGGLILIRLNIFALVLCLFILWKGYYHPTTKVTRYRGDVISDFFWGCDLYPSIFGVDLKVWTNCRMGMTMWPLVIISCVFYQYEKFGLEGLTTNMICSAILQLTYITKFFWWEGGYYSTIDIM